jgi:hypothetical protein
MVFNKSVITMLRLTARVMPATAMITNSAVGGKKREGSP